VDRTPLEGPVFVSYRRDDAASEAASIASQLRQRIGNDAVYLDVASNPPGVIWPEELRNAHAAAHCVVVVIGPRWLSMTDENGERRLDDKDDLVRHEIALALSSGKTVVPVLVDGAVEPRADMLPEALKKLTERQAVSLRRDYFDHDILLLVDRFALLIEPLLRDELEGQLRACAQLDVKWRSPHILRALLNRDPSYAAECISLVDPSYLSRLNRMLDSYFSKQSSEMSERGFVPIQLESTPLLRAASVHARTDALTAIDERVLLLAFLDSDGSTVSRIRRDLGERFERLRTVVATNRPGQFRIGTPGFLLEDT
jgi:TIR domain-containing protein